MNEMDCCQSDYDESSTSSCATADLLDTDTMIDQIWNCYMTRRPQPSFAAEQVLLLFEEADRVLAVEPSLLELHAPINICGDLYGHIESLVALFSVGGGAPPNASWLFLGNYSGMCNRPEPPVSSILPFETLLLLLAFKVRYPQHIHLLRGHFETEQTGVTCGLRELIDERYPEDNEDVWLALLAVYNQLPLAATINDVVLCMHGGFGEQLLEHGLDAIRRLQRPIDVEEGSGIVAELVWSSLSVEDDGFGLATDDGSPTFGAPQVAELCAKLNLQLVVHGRQILDNGVLILPDQLVTLWSAAEFRNKFTNAAGMLQIDDELKTTVVRYRRRHKAVTILQEPPTSTTTSLSSSATAEH